MRRVLAFALGLLALPTAARAQILEYYHLDAIGNVRAVTDQSGNIVERHDYLPFGEECTTGPCALNPGVGAGQAKKFTGKERDAETGFDYFGARYYGSKIGRFTTTDPVYTWRENLVDPQRWNRYAYSRNNPLRYVDPDGKQSFPVSALLVTTLDPPSRLTNRIDTGLGMIEGFLMTVVPGLEIGANSPDQAAGQVMGQAITVVGSMSALARRGGGALVTRYMTEGEVNEALRTGNIPNYGRDGLPRPTHVTTDAPVNSATQAAARYEITPPTHRATVPGRRVEGLGPAPDGRPTTSGGGGQAVTNSPVPVKPSEIKPLER